MTRHCLPLLDGVTLLNVTVKAVISILALCITVNYMFITFCFPLSHFKATLLNVTVKALISILSLCITVIYTFITFCLPLCHFKHYFNDVVLVAVTRHCHSFTKLS